MCHVSVDCAYCSRSAAWTKLPVSAITLNVCKCRRSIILKLSVKMNVCFEYFVLFDRLYSVILMERKQIIRVTTFVQNPVCSRGIQQEKGQNDYTTSGSIRASLYSSNSTSQWGPFTLCHWRSRISGGAAPRLASDLVRMAKNHACTRREIYGDRARFAWDGRFGKNGKRL